MTDVNRLEGYLLKVDDTGPPLRVQLLRDDGEPKNLTGFTPTVSVSRSDSDTPTISDATMQIENESNGIVSYDWSSSDTNTGGTYIAEIVIDDGSGTTMTFPNNDFFNVRIQEGL